MGFSFSADFRHSLPLWWNDINQSSSFIYIWQSITKCNITAHISTSALTSFYQRSNCFKSCHVIAVISLSRKNDKKNVGICCVEFSFTAIRCLWTVNGAQCTVEAAALQIDYTCHCWSTWNDWPLPEWSQVAYKCILYKQSTGGQSEWNRYLMETSIVYCSLYSERQMAICTVV